MECAKVKPTVNALLVADMALAKYEAQRSIHLATLSKCKLYLGDLQNVSVSQRVPNTDLMHPSGQLNNLVQSLLVYYSILSLSLSLSLH